MRGIYKNLCLNCEGSISDERLLQLGICENCLEDIRKFRNLTQVLKELREKGKLKFAGPILNFQERLKDFSNFFKKLLGHRMWSLQETWARRILLGKNFSIVAPTGVGKTVLGVAIALYFARERKKSYLVVPTGLLVQQILEKIENFLPKLDFEVRVVYYHGALKKREKEEALQKISNGDFDILVTTDRFMTMRFELLKNKGFDFVFVDDVDSFLKSPKNIDRVLSVLGFDDEIIEIGFQLLDLRKEASKLARMGKSPERVLEKIERYRGKIERYKQKRKVGILVVSGATMKAKRTKRIKLFEEFLGFQIGFKPEFLRNIRDFYIPMKKSMIEHVFEILKEFGTGCLIFVPSPLGKDYAIELNRELNERGINSYVYRKMDERILEKFEKGEYDTLVGVASFRSPLARGIDLPARIRYVIFAGVPRIEIPLSSEEFNPTKILTLLKNLRSFLSGSQQEKATEVIMKLRKIIPLDKETQEKIREAIESGSSLKGFEEFAKKIIVEARDFLKRVITPELIEKIANSKEASIKREGGIFYLIVADPVAYVQASGRASRMFAGGISRGASILIVDEEKAFYSLQQNLRFIIPDISWKKFELKSARRWFEKIDEDRRLIKEISEGKVIEKVKDYIKSALLIVESPTKARTISKFFGKPSKRKIGNVTIFETSTGKFTLSIVASKGHIYDLTINEGFHGVKIVNGKFVPVYDFIKKCLDCGEQFTGSDVCPKCKSTNISSKEDLVKILRELSLEVNQIFIATDPDTEGEKIAYDIYCSVYPMNNRVERLEFHEITKQAFLEAMKKRRKIDPKLVEAQIVRRVEDRWIGFELSQKLWTKFRTRRLSAGRVQTPVLGWIIERTSESRKKKIVLSTKLSNRLTVFFENPRFKFPFHQLREYVKRLRARITDLVEEERTVHPFPPYTTDTLLKDASSKLKFSASKTMRLAQDLFELGLCTYHRTDSTTVSTFGLRLAKEYINEKYPSLFVGRRYLKEGAHECIRPTRPIDTERLRSLISLGLLRFPRKLTREHFQLYDMIFKRFIASQMKEVVVIYQRFKVRLNGNEVSVERPVEIKEEGFNKVAPLKVEERVEEGEYRVMYAKILKLPAAWPFSQGEVISLMKERGIGRPSTYAKILSTLLERKYVFEKRNRLFNTKLGFKVYMYLKRKFGEYISEETTRKLETLMDEVEGGKIDYQHVLSELYDEILKLRERI